MSIARIVTRGFGTFSDVNELPVRGWTIGVSVIAPPVVFLDTRYIQQSDTMILDIEQVHTNILDIEQVHSGTLDIEQVHSGVLYIQQTVTHAREL